MLELIELVGHESGDSRVEGPVFIVSFEGDANVFAPAPICGDVVPPLERLFEVVCMIVADEFDAKIIHYESE